MDNITPRLNIFVNKMRRERDKDAVLDSEFKWVRLHYSFLSVHGRMLILTRQFVKRRIDYFPIQSQEGRAGGELEFHHKEKFL